MLDDWKSAPVAPTLRAMLAFLEKLTLTPDEVSAADARAVLDAGVSEQAFEDAVAVTALFNAIDRIADTFEFHIPTAEQFVAAGHGLLKRGYRL